MFDKNEATPRGIDQQIAVRRPASFDAEQYRRLRLRIERMQAEKGVRSIAVTSPVAGDGKTQTAVNLAAALAESPTANVLLIDADLRRPSVTKRLGQENQQEAGLVAALASAKPQLDRWVRPSGIDNLSLVPSGHVEGSSYELLSSPKLADLLQQARQRYTFVIIDTPPLVPVLDSSLLSGVVDGYVVVVAAHRTQRKFLAEALNQLEPASVLGLVYNRDDRPLLGYREQDYRHYFATARGASGKGNSFGAQ
jgi:capsular exopolysaccharide synthesis family protein